MSKTDRSPLPCHSGTSRNASLTRPPIYKAKHEVNTERVCSNQETVTLSSLMHHTFNTLL